MSESEPDRQTHAEGGRSGNGSARSGNRSRAGVVAAIAATVALLVVGGWAIVSDVEGQRTPSFAFPSPTPTSARVVSPTAMVTATATARASSAAEVPSGSPGIGNRTKSASPEPEVEQSPPKLELIWVNAATGSCPTYFSGDIRVLAKGKVDRMDAEWRSPEQKLTITRGLTEFGDEWSTFLSAIPTNKTVKLIVIGRGPGGTTTVGQDISYRCKSDRHEFPRR